MAVSITDSVGYEGTVDEPQWARLMAYAGGRQYGVIGEGDWKVTPGTADREIRIAPGSGFGSGVLDRTTAAASLTLPAPASGSRWHLIAVRRDWQNNLSSFDSIAGSTTTAQIPIRQTTPGTSDDQPIALVRVQAGQSQVAEVRDLRVWGGDGGAFAVDDLVRQYLNRVGTHVRINAVDWDLTLNVLGSPTWVASGDNSTPPYFSGRFVRSDGQRIMNSGQTLMRWQGTDANTLGGEASAGSSGATYRLPPGVHLVTATIELDAPACFAQLLHDVTGATLLGATGDEVQSPGGYFALSTMRLLHVAETGSITVRLASNQAGSIRADGTMRIARIA